MNAIEMLAAYRPLESDAEAEWTPAHHAAVRGRILAAPKVDRVDRRLTSGRRGTQWPARIGVSAAAVAAAAIVAVLVSNSGTTRTPDAGASPTTATGAPTLTGKPLPAIALVAYNVRTSGVTPAVIRSYHWHKLLMQTTRTGLEAWHWQDATFRYTATGLTIDYGPPQFLSPTYAERSKDVDGQPIPVGQQTVNNPCTNLACITGLGNEFDPDYIRSLPTGSAESLAKAFEREGPSGWGGCGGLNDAACESETVLGLLGQNGVSAALHATALDLLAEIPGVTVLGDRTIAGHRGLAVHLQYVADGGARTVVLDKQTGEQLAYYFTEPGPASSQDTYVPPVPIGTVIFSLVRTD